jgi:hypothetical protein
MGRCTSCGREETGGLLSGRCLRCDKIAGDAYLEAIWLSGVKDNAV